MLKHLRQKKADLIAEANGLHQAADTEQRFLSEAEAARDDAITLELASLDRDIQRAEAQADRQRSLGAMAGSMPIAGNGRVDAPRFASFGEQMMAVMNAERRGGTVDPRLMAGPTGMNEGVGQDGGFLVQTDFATELLQRVWDTGEIASRIRKYPIGPNSNGLTMNGVDETSRANGSRAGGIQAFWTGEAQLKIPSQPKFRTVKMDLWKLTGLCYATDEMLQDSVQLEAWLQDAFNSEMEFKIEDAIVNGSGSGMPLGLLNSGCTITVPKQPGQAANSFVGQNAFDMWVRMPTRSRKTCVWLANADIEAQLLGLAVGGQFSLPGLSYAAPGTVPGQDYGLLMGRPVIPVEYCGALGQAGDIILADLSQYQGIDKGPTQQATSIHVRFIYDETCFRFVYRFNGQPLWSAPVIPYKGSTTTAPFVLLANRS